MVSGTPTTEGMLIMHHSAFPAILVEHGFDPDEYDFQATALGFHHDIYNALIHGSSVFNDQSRIYHQLHLPDALLRCELVRCAGNAEAAIPHFYQQWVTELRYQYPVREVLDLHQQHHTATVHALLISQHNAMTFEFNIT